LLAIKHHLAKSNGIAGQNQTLDIPPKIKTLKYKIYKMPRPPLTHHNYQLLAALLTRCGPSFPTN